MERAYSPDLFDLGKIGLALAIGVLGGLLFIWLSLPLPWMLGQ